MVGEDIEGSADDSSNTSLKSDEPAPPLPPFNNHAELEVAVRDFFAEGWPSLLRVMGILSEEEMPPELRMLLFPMIGGYLNAFSQVLQKVDDSNLMIAHHFAMTAVMSDPSVGEFIHTQLQNIIGSKIGELV